jgi:uncharacterized FlaG/YvyC family protein
MERIGGITPGKGPEVPPPAKPVDEGKKASRQDAEPKSRAPNEDRDVQARGRGEGRRSVEEPPSPMDVAAEFIVDPRTHRVTVRITNIRTGEVIRIIPPGKLMELISQLAGKSAIDRKV